MDQTNRVLIVGAALLWIFVLLVIVLLAWGAADDSIAQIADLAGYLEDHNNTEAKLLLTFGGLIFVLLAAIVVIVEVAPAESGSLKVERIGSGEARIGTDEVAQRLEDQIRALPHVAQAQVSVIARGAKAEVTLDLQIGPEAELAVTTEEAGRLTRYLLEERMGVALTRPPQAQLQYRELQVSRPPAPSSPGEPPAPSTPGEPPAPEPAAPAIDPPMSTEASHYDAETSREDRPAGL